MKTITTKVTLIVLLLMLQAYIAIVAQCLNPSTIAPGGSVAICAGDLLSVPAQSGASYQWKQNPAWSTIGSTSSAQGPDGTESMAIDANGNIYVAFLNSNNDDHIIVMEYTGGTWVRIDGDNVGRGSGTSLAISNNGNLYVAFGDAANSSYLSVRKYDGTNWTSVGAPDFSPNNAQVPKIALDATGTPYVFFEDFTGSFFDATVMKFDGTNWVFVGAEAFSTHINSTSIAFDKNNAPWIVYDDDANGGVVKKFDGSNWVQVGSTISSLNGYPSNGNVASPIIGFDPSGNAYVCYNGVVVKFDGTNWVEVGNANYSANQAYNQSMAIDGAGNIYVVYNDGGHTGPAQMVKYNGSSWVVVGAADFSTAFVSQPRTPVVVLNSNGIPYVASQFDVVTVYKYDGTNVGTNSNTYSPTSTGTYQVSLSKSCGGALSENTTTVTAINPLPQGSLTANGPFCADGAGQLTWTATTGTGHYTVVYNDGVANHTANGVVSGTAFNVYTTPVTSTTTYSLMSVNDSNCQRTSGFTSGSATITINTVACLNGGTTNTSCGCDCPPGFSGVYCQTVSCTGTINVQGNGNNIANGSVTPSVSNNTDFQNASATHNMFITYTIQNTGASALSVGAITFSGANASDFTVNTPPASTVTAEGSTTFVVQFAPSALGTRTATINIANSSCSGTTYAFAMSGTGVVSVKPIAAKSH